MEIRKSKGYSQENMANELNIGISTYCQYETGKRNIPRDIVSRICNILDVKIDDIFLPVRFTISKQNKK